jgi:hypothetical protein
MTANNILNEYASLLNAFDNLIGSCSTQLNEYSHDPSPNNKIIIETCLLERRRRTNMIHTSCGIFYDAYEECMNKEPDNCVQPLALLYACARKNLEKE